MGKYKFYINNIEVPAPENHKEMELELNFDQDSPTAEITTQKWHFVNSNANLINQYISDGLNGGNGVFHGLKFDVVISERNAVEKFELYLDLADGAEFSKNEVFASSKEYSKLTWLTDVADGFTFQYLHEETSFLPSSKFVSVPYVINSIPNYRDVFLVTLSVAFIYDQLQEELTYFAEVIAGAANPFVSVSAVIQFAVHIAYTIGLMIALVKLIKDIIDLIIQPVKYHKGMYAYDLLDCGFDYLGLTFESSILTGIVFKDLLILPEKYENPPDSTDDRILGFINPSNNQKGYYNGTFADFIRAMKETFNAKLIFQGSTVKLERVDWNGSVESYIIPDVRQDFERLNTEDFFANYLIEFATDGNDKNTVQEYTGTIYQNTISPISYTDEKLRLMRGLKQVKIPFALGKRKETLTIPERVLDTFLSVVGVIMNGLIAAANGVISIVNAIGDIIDTLGNILDFFGIDNNLEGPDVEPLDYVDFGAIINDRIGMLMLENDSVLIPKMLLVERGSTDRKNKIYASHKSYLSAKYLWDNYHNINSFVPTAINPNGNQWKIKTVNVRFSLNDFLLVKNNNRIFDYNGRKCLVDKLKWNPWNNYATITYRVNEVYTNNLKQSGNEGQGY